MHYHVITHADTPGFQGASHYAPTRADALAVMYEIVATWGEQGTATLSNGYRDHYLADDGRCVLALACITPHGVAA